MARLPVDIMTMGDRQSIADVTPPSPQANAANFGSQVGSALGQIGEAGSRLAASIMANKKQNETFGYEQQFLKLQEEDNLAYGERLRDLGGTADGHWETSREETQKRFDNWVKTLPPTEQEKYRTRSEDFIVRRSQGAFEDQYKQQDKNTDLTLTEEERKAGRAVQDSPASYDEYVAQQFALIDASTLPASEKEARKAELKNTLALTAEKSRAEQDPEGFIASTASSNPIAQEIAVAASARGLPPDLVLAVVMQESGFNPEALSSAGAYGLFQHMPDIQSKNGTGRGATIEQQIKGGLDDLEERVNVARRVLGRDPTPGEYYVIHFQGIGAGPRILQTPGADFRATLDAAGGTGWANKVINSNPYLAGLKTNADFIAWSEQKMAKFTGKVPPPSSYQNLSADQAAEVNEAAMRNLQQQRNNETAMNLQAQQDRRDQAYLDIKEGSSPGAAFSQAKNDGLFATVDELGKAEAILAARKKADTDAAVGVSIMNGGFVNGFDKNHMDAVDSFYGSQITAGADPAAAAAAVFDKTGVIPSDFATALRGAISSGNKDMLTATLPVISNMLAENPNAFASVTGKSDFEAIGSEFDRLTGNLGMSADQAAERILQDRQNPVDPLKNGALDSFKKDTLNFDTVSARITSVFDSYFGAEPVMPPGRFGDAYASIYGSYAEEGFRQFGNSEAALAYADKRLQKEFGVQNGFMTRYPPDKSGLPPMSDGSGFEWINKQAVDMVREEFGVEVDPSQIILVPIERGTVSTKGAFDGRPLEVSRPDGSKYKTVPYTIVVKSKDEGEVPLISTKVYLPDANGYIGAMNAAAAETPLTDFMFGIPAPVPTPDPLKTAEQQQAEADAALAASAEAARAAPINMTQEEYNASPGFLAGRRNE